VEVRVAPGDGGVVLTVSDTGTGIPPRSSAVCSSASTAFAASLAATRLRHRPGLVKELTDLHGGEISVLSSEGEGSRFTVWLPVGSGHLPPIR